jgi:16S rRNA G966 N2-methylase RsmD
VLVTEEKISYVGPGCEFFFHPGLAGLRIDRLSQGGVDRMVEAMSLEPGDRVLDCTLGLGTDAIVAAYSAGGTGEVVGLESSLLLACLVEEGLGNYKKAEPRLQEAMSRVKVVHTGHYEYMQGLSANSFDVVYFDPMFRQPLKQSPAINALRLLADPAPLEQKVMELAVNIARKRVVLKERRGSSEYSRLGFATIYGGRYAPVQYGVIDCRGSGYE